MMIRSLAPGDNRAVFRSGNIDLDRFFRRFAGQNQFRHYVGVTYVAVDGESILGFVTVAAASIEVWSLSPAARKRFPVYPVPVLRLARLAVGEAAQGQGIGSSLLRFVFLLALEMARSLVCVGVVIDAKEEAIPVYARYGFEALGVEAGRLGDRPVPTPMFLEIGAISKPGKARP